MISISEKIILAVIWSLLSFTSSLSSSDLGIHTTIPSVISVSSITLSHHHTLSFQLVAFHDHSSKKVSLHSDLQSLDLVSYLTGKIEGNRRQISHNPLTTSTLYVPVLYTHLSPSQHEWHKSVFMSKTLLYTFAPEPIPSCLFKDIATKSIPYLFCTNIFISKWSWWVIPPVLKTPSLDAAFPVSCCHASLLPF